MKMVIKIVAVLLFCATLLASCAPLTDDVLKKSEEGRYLYLVAGYDDAAENTDVLFTLGYDKSDNTVKIAQIPRDTYAYFGASQNKINQFYASQVFSGKSKYDAMTETAEFIGSIFGVTFDGFIGLGTATFRHIVDALGGVDITLSSDMTIEIDGEESLLLKSGTNHVNGADAEKFIRYRKGYVMGDLGRMDAQKMFLSSLLKRLSSELTLPTLLRIAGILQNEATASIRLASFSSLVMDAVRGGTVAEYITVPGEPAVSQSGLSYYILNRKCAAEIAERYMFAEREFDPERVLRNVREHSFVNIYDDEDFEMREFREAVGTGLEMNKRKE